jgi:hypothetical protein
MSEFLTIDEILADRIKKSKKILSVKEHSKLIEQDADIYKCVNIDDLYQDNKFSYKSDMKFDYVILNEILEEIDDPVDLIKNLRLISATVIIVEQKYDVPGLIKNHWKTPWKKQGLEWHLNLMFDYINSLYLTYQTIHTCELPAPHEIEYAN